MATPLPGLDIGNTDWCCFGTGCCGVFIIGMAAFVILFYGFAVWFAWKAFAALSVFLKK